MTDRLHVIACTVAEALTAFNRNVLTILLFVPACLIFIAFGWSIGKTELYLLIITTALSINASWTNRLQLLKQAQMSGEAETEGKAR